MRHCPYGAMRSETAVVAAGHHKTFCWAEAKAPHPVLNKSVKICKPGFFFFAVEAEHEQDQSFSVGVVPKPATAVAILQGLGRHSFDE